MSVFLNNFVESLKTKADFAIQIGEGKLNSHYQPLSEDDILGNALINMEKSLQKAEMEDQKYKDEEKKRIWANEGIARFGEILRLHNNDLTKLSDEIIQNLVRYLNASQGGLFYINDDTTENVSLDMVAAFAYDRKKFIDKKILLGEGLVGTVALEKEKVFITEVPDNYLTISSGLGESVPRSILVVPLKLEDEILGVIELASFNIFAPHEIDFVEKIGQTIASTITGVKINARTAKLLEQSQKQGEEMAEQEEEMRQNMEELRTTQEDFARREAEITSILNAVNTTALVLFYDMDARIIDVNNKLLELLTTKREDIVGRSHSELSSLGRTPDEYQKFWDKLRKNIVVSHIEKIRLPNGRELWLNQTYTPILDRAGIPIKVICISSDITEVKSQQSELVDKTKQLEFLTREYNYITTAVDENLLRCTYSPEGRIIDANVNYCSIIGHSQSELLGKMHIAFLKDDEKNTFERMWENALKFESFNGIFMMTSANNTLHKLLVNFNPVKDSTGNLAKVFFIARDITNDTL
jgi:PAS domain S-box-containing protein